MTWYEDLKWRDRLLVEHALMEERFPGFTLLRGADGRLTWAGQVEVGTGRPFQIAITYPTNYPYSEPEIRVTHPQLQGGAPHVYLDGRLCLHRRRWDPFSGTAVASVPLTAEWLLHYVHWLSTREPY